MKPAKILFISAPIGAGHARAAQAVGAAMQSLRPDVCVRYADVSEFLPAWLGRAIVGGYFKLLDVFPEAYGLAYGLGNRSPLALWGREQFSAFLAGRMRRRLASYRPDVVVCTHAAPAGLAAWLAARRRLGAPAVAVVTDFVVHRLWINPGIDAYFVAAEELRAFLAEHGVDMARSQASGIPVSPAATAGDTRRRTLERLGLSPARRTVLLMGGGSGVTPLPEIIERLGECREPLQILAVAGRNGRLEKRLRACRVASRHRLRSFGFVDFIPQLMAAADLLISKPGGLTVAESLCAGLPLLIYKPIPGQEEGNTAFLLRRGAAVRAADGAALGALTEELLWHSPGRLAAMRRRAQDMGRPGAALEIARAIFSRYNL